MLIVFRAGWEGFTYKKTKNWTGIFISFYFQSATHKKNEFTVQRKQGLKTRI